MNSELLRSAEDHSALKASQVEATKHEQETASTKEIVDRHLKCFGISDLGGILSDYAPDAVMFTENGTLRGVNEIKPLFQALIAEFEKPGAAFSMKLQSVEGDVGYILWNAETSDNVYELGTDTFIVRRGKIIVQSFTAKITAKD